MTRCFPAAEAPFDSAPLRRVPRVFDFFFVVVFFAIKGCESPPGSVEERERARKCQVARPGAKPPVSLGDASGRLEWRGHPAASPSPILVVVSIL